ncbi:Protein of unknown function [Thermomonospora echinospora]|uniref:DUF2530 domain-containing protein n=1 Tax=Thermomonospora echinospora TaxID=1992 RepID=A0A1H6E406_9ACTN|nr:DUF2530 domain-containing protein [Thermomonospora echinospora]SEG92390.1 Protein of unknown function [Thermomonospora echinospora]
MTSPRRPDPPPLRTDDRLIAAVGSAAWAIALVVLLIVGLPEHDRWWLWVCATGIAIGGFGYWYLPRLHRGRAAAVQRRTDRGARQTPLPDRPSESGTADAEDAVADETPRAQPPA